MKLVMVFILIALSVSGCATAPGQGKVSVSPKQDLARAVGLLEKKKNADAAELLSAVCAAPPVQGITDEALFRLSLLHLGSGQEKSVARARQELDRLKKEFPGSSWAPLAAALSATLAEDQAHLRKLKELNASLAKDNRELRQTIEQLKNLEMELGKKGTRR